MNASIEPESEHTVSVSVLNAVMEIMERMGIARRDELVLAAGLTHVPLDVADARVPERDAQRLIEIALELSGDEALGLRWGERLTVDAFAPVSYLIAHARTLRNGLQSMAQFQSLLTDRVCYETVERGEEIWLRSILPVDHAPRLQRFTAELSVCGFLYIVRGFHPHWRPERVCFEYAAPAYRAEYARVFGDVERFDQPFTGIGIDPALLDAPSLHKDDGIHTALQELAEKRLARSARSAPYAVRVRQYLIEHGRAAELDMSSVARALDLSVRSLRRRLSAEGKSFAQLESEAFDVLARRLLVDQALTIQQAAEALGFTSTSSFHRTFKRFTGMTPKAFREAQLGLRRT